VKVATTAREREAAVRHARRATGQASALASMIGSDRPFAEVAQQLLAVRGSLDSLLVRLVELELSDCVPARETRREVDELLRVALGARRARPSGGPTPGYVQHGGTAR